MSFKLNALPENTAEASKTSPDIAIGARKGAKTDAAGGRARPPSPTRSVVITNHKGTQ